MMKVLPYIAIGLIYFTAFRFLSACRRADERINQLRDNRDLREQNEAKLAYLKSKLEGALKK